MPKHHHTEPDERMRLAERITEAIADLVRYEARLALAERAAVTDFLSTAQAAAYAKVTPTTIRRWIVAGKLPGHRVGKRIVRVVRADIDGLLRRGIRHPPPRGIKDKTPEELAREHFG